MRYLHLLLLGVVPLVLSAAPIPKESEASKLYRIYGTWSDPHKDSKFALKGSELRVALPAAERLVGKEREGARDNAPRALREVEGDFTAIVRVTFPVPERVPMSYWPYCSGGIVAWESDKSYLVARRTGGKVNGSAETIWSHVIYETQTIATIQGVEKRADAAFVRLKREGNKAIVGRSRDGKAWKDFVPFDVAWSDKIKVGVVAENCLGEPVEITFDQYSLTQPKK